MNSRERVLRTVNFQDTDRMPIDLGAMKASGIGVKAYNRVKARLSIFKPGGGYVFNQVHNIQPNVPAENIIAMLDAACEYA